MCVCVLCERACVRDTACDDIQGVDVWAYEHENTLCVLCVFCVCVCV
ncbi:MAG: hypothetical protein P4L40_04820 [Terracidiphilus sp.]|nr:hypothetical protein [Terracidiphilus sp.]